MNKKIGLKSIVLIFSLLFIACKHNIDVNHKLEAKKISVTVNLSNSYDKSSSSNRAATPDLSHFFYEVTATSSNGSSTEKSYSNNKTLDFTLAPGTYTFVAKAYLAETKDAITGKTPVLVSEPMNVSISSENPTVDKLVLKLNKENNANGNVNLSLQVTDSRIQSCKLIFSDKEIKGNVLDGKIILSQADISVGSYVVTYEFYSAQDCTSEVIVSYEDVLTVLADENTSYFSSSENSFIKNGIFKIDTEILNQLISHSYYVDTTKTYYEDGGEKAYGSRAAPFNSFNKAIEYIHQVNEGNDDTPYVIYLMNDCQGNVSGVDTLENEWTISSSKKLNLTIQSYSGNNSIHTINANKNSGNPGRAFYISGTNGADVNLTLKNIKIIGGYMDNKSGSEAADGVYIGENATLTLDGLVEITSVGGKNDGCVIIADSISSDTKFNYIPKEYKIASQIVTGPGFGEIKDNITIPETIVDGEAIDWELTGDGKLKKTKIYVSELQEEPEPGSIVYVKNEEDLKALAGFVNDGQYTNPQGIVLNLNRKITFAEVTVIQEKNITLSTSNWIPIGLRDFSSGNDTSVFMGYYDGKNYSITDLMMLNSVSSSLGLFGNICDASISNLNVSCQFILQSASIVRSAGVIAAFATSSAIQNCTVSGSIGIESTNEGATIGGICGESYYGGLIEDCISSCSSINVTVCSNNQIGGIAGKINENVTISNCKNVSTLTNTSDNINYIGGIAGYCYDSQILNCINDNKITSQPSCYVGGITGSVESTDNYIINNYSKLSAKRGNVSGIIGYIEFGSDCVELENCVAEIQAQETSASFGIINAIYRETSPESVIVNCYWTADTTLELKPNGSKGVSVVDSYSFTPDDETWYGTLLTPVSCGTDKKTKALVYALNCYANDNTSDSLQLNTWCVSDGKLSFGPAPSGEPLYTQTTSYNIASLNFIPQTGDELIVETKDDLFALAKLVNDGTNGIISLNNTEKLLSGVVIKQIQPIDLENEEWEPIGTYAKNACFNGIYDGNNKLISNMKVTSSIDNSPGLFGRVTQDTNGGGIIKNVIVSGEITVKENNYAYVGGVVSELTSGEVYNCVSDVYIINSSSNTASYTGGVVGKITGSASVYGCEYKNEIFLNHYSQIAGGIVGRVDGVGRNNIYNCINTGTIVSDNSIEERLVGGIVGNVGVSNTSIFNNCNSGIIKGNSGSRGSAGGIIGTFNTSSASIKIYNCINVAEVSGFTCNYSICGTDSSSYLSNTISIIHCFGIDGVELNALVSTNSNVTIENLSKFTLNTSGGILSSSIDGTTNILDALNAWVEQENQNSGNAVYETWAYDSVNGFHFGVQQSSGKTYISDLTAADLISGETYYVGDAEDLKKLAVLVNSGSTFENITISQEQPIYLGNEEWTPIGNGGDSFSGTYLGNGNEISGLKISSSNTTTSPGLFGNLYEATIDGVIVSGNINSNAEYIGGIAGSIACSVMKNCVSSVVINCSDSSNIMNYIGGLVGLAVYDGNYGSDIDNCCYAGEINVSGKIRAAGGIAGGVSIGTSLNISNTVNRGDISYTGSIPTTSEISLAGFIGELLYDENISETSGAEIINCGNKGKVTGVSSGSGAYCYASGLVCSVGKQSVLNMENCFNISEISGGTKNIAFVANERQDSIVSLNYMYWEKTLCEYWRDGKNATANTNYQSSNPNPNPVVFNTSKTGGYSNGGTLKWGSVTYIENGLNLWIDNNEDAISGRFELIKWNHLKTGGGNYAQGCGEPALPIEDTFISDDLK